MIVPRLPVALVLGSVVALAVAAPLPGSTVAQQSLQGEAAALHARLMVLDRAFHRDADRLARPLPGGDQTVAAPARSAARLLAGLGDLQAAVEQLPDSFEAQVLARKAAGLRLLVHQLREGDSIPGEAAAGPLAGRWQEAGEHDACASALPVASGVSLRGDTSQGRTGAVWFRLEGRDRSRVTIDTTGSAFDTTLAVFTHCPDAATQPIDANDDAYGLRARLALTAERGQVRYVRLDGFGGTTGRYHLRVGTFGSIAGEVTTANGAPVLGTVVAYHANGSYAGSGWLQSGGYEIPGLSAGSYVVHTSNTQGLVDELYDDIPCTPCDPTTGDAVSVTEGTSTTVDFVLSPGGVLTGRVRDETTGLGLPGATVELFGANGDGLAYRSTDAAGRWTFTGLATGTYFASADAESHLGELYDDQPCESFCIPTGGTPIDVVFDQVTAGIDISLRAWGAVTGQVVASDTGEPIRFLSVIVHSESPYIERYGSTDSQGRYFVGGLPPATYTVQVETSEEFRNEVWADQPCWDRPCTGISGTPIPIAENQVVSGIDFALDRLGSISGTVTYASTGSPVGSTVVSSWNAIRGWGYDDTLTGPSGTYRVRDLYPGSQFIVVWDRPWLYDVPRFLAEVYDDVPCLPTCDPSLGTPVPLAAGQDVQDIDTAVLALGWIEGSVREAGGALPLAEVAVELHDDSGTLVATRSTQPSGHFEFSALLPGTYFVSTDTSAHRNEVYDDLPCSGACDPTTGTPLVVLEEGVVGVDFILDRFGSFTGVLRNSATGDRIPGEVDVRTASGSLVRRVPADEQGNYDSRGLDAGTYYAVGHAPGHRSELYDALPCDPGCDPTAGTPITVAFGAQTADVDFDLDRFGSIAGTVIDVFSGEGMESVYVEIFDAGGSYLGAARSSAGGSYRYDGLDTGTYYAAVFPPWHLPQLYDGLPCGAGCSVTDGTPIPVVFGATTTGVHFNLEAGGGIGGRVTDTAGLPVAGVSLDFWTAAGVWVGSSVTAGDGRYRGSLDGGQYYVSTDNGLGALDEIHEDVPCPLGPAYLGLCDPLVGSLVTVDADLPYAVVDFELSGVPLFVSGFEGGDLGEWTNGPPGP